MHGNFLCGCSPAEKRFYSGNTIPSVIPGGDPSYSDKRFDSEGYEVCPEHGERLYGWKTLPMHPLSRRPDYGLLGSPVNPRANYNVDVPDTRDNRDPQEVWEELQLQRSLEKASTNGHA